MNVKHGYLMNKTLRLGCIYVFKYVFGALLVDAKTGRGRIAGIVDVSSTVESKP
jgi:hypothetical protein